MGKDERGKNGRNPIFMLFSQKRAFIHFHQCLDSLNTEQQVCVVLPLNLLPKTYEMLTS